MNKAYYITVLLILLTMALTNAGVCIMLSTNRGWMIEILSLWAVRIAQLEVMKSPQNGWANRLLKVFSVSRPLFENKSCLFSAVFSSFFRIRAWLAQTQNTFKKLGNWIICIKRAKKFNFVKLVVVVSFKEISNLPLLCHSNLAGRSL